MGMGIRGSVWIYDRIHTHMQMHTYTHRCRHVDTHTGIVSILNMFPHFVYWEGLEAMIPYLASKIWYIQILVFKYDSLIKNKYDSLRRVEAWKIQDDHETFCHARKHPIHYAHESEATLKMFPVAKSGMNCTKK